MVPGDNSEARLPTTPIVAIFHEAGPLGSPAIQSVARGAIGYPARLERAVPRPPDVLWWKGRLPRGTGRAIAIVGSRAASGAGCDRARALAAGLAARGWAVISGGAFGIDAAAHTGALDCGGETFAVLGCGVDVVYPDRHATLFDRIVGAGGGLLAELPPGTRPRPGQFPSRNRIVAALAEAVLVVEAAGRSGALSTAGYGRRTGLPVLAVAGSAGCDRMIKAGRALAVETVEEIEEGVAGRLAGSQGALALGAPPAPPEAFAALVEALRAGADTPGGLARRLGLPLPSVMGLLVEAELEGWVRRAPGSQYEVPFGD